MLGSSNSFLRGFGVSQGLVILEHHTFGFVRITFEECWRQGLLLRSESAQILESLDKSNKQDFLSFVEFIIRYDDHIDDDSKVVRTHLNIIRGSGVIRCNRK